MIDFTVRKDQRNLWQIAHDFAATEIRIADTAMKVATDAVRMSGGYGSPRSTRSRS
jgi:hypothetical protein